jgi:methylamine utilization protein MauE
LAVVVGIALAGVLGYAAASKLRAPRRAAGGTATFGVPERLRLPAVLAVTLLEAALAVGVALGSSVAAYAAAALTGAFAVVVAAAVLRGASGAPCGCFGPGSRVGIWSVVRNGVLAGAFVALPSLPSGSPSREGWLLVGLVAAFACIAALAVAVLALAREVGLLRLRIGTEAALDVADEGPPIGSRVAVPDRFAADAPLRLAIFSSEGCRLCQTLRPVVAAFRHEPEVAVEVFDEVDDADVWQALRIPGSPFAVALDRAGAVRAKGTFNSYGQLESILASAERGAAEARA